MYVFAYQVKNGSSYSIKAVKEGFDNIEATTIVNKSVANLGILSEKLENNAINASINIEDIKNEDNYYQVTMRWGDFTEDSAIINDPFYYEPWMNTYSCSNDFIIEYPQSDVLDGSNCSDRFLFSDNVFKNGSYELKLFTNPGNFYPNPRGL